MAGRGTLNLYDRVSYDTDECEVFSPAWDDLRMMPDTLCRRSLRWRSEQG